MEQNEKVFERLNNKFVELQTEFINLSNEKAKMENDALLYNRQYIVCHNVFFF